jgi:hypothetical protein
MLTSLTLLILLIINGPEQLFMAEDVKKGIKKHVVDKERRELLLEHISDGRKQIKAFNKRQEKLAAAVQKEILDKEGHDKRINHLLDSALDLRKQHQQRLIDDRLWIQENLSQQEWDLIVAKSAFPSDKDSSKNQKKRNKTQTSYKDYLAKVRETITASIADDGQREKALAAYQTFSDQHEEFVKMRTELDYENQEILRRQDLSRAELEDFYAQQDTLRQNTYKSFVDLFSSIKENSSEEEWGKIKKSLAKIVEER